MERDDRVVLIPGEVGVSGGDAVVDAEEVLRRAAADQDAADEARVRLRRDGLRALPPDMRIAPLLAAGERVVALRRAALLDRRDPSPGARAAGGVGGDLYVTTRRLVLVGRVTLSFALQRIDDAVMSGERLLLALRDGQGVMLQVEQPRRLAVEIAAARAAARAGSAIEAPEQDQPAAR